MKDDCIIFGLAIVIWIAMWWTVDVLATRSAASFRCPTCGGKDCGGCG